ncbi:MAG: hypothetical protein KC503_04940 [Myxococcales bacterium]|nr:hypothetical protein [Myxococcales bacterium]
MRLLSSFNTFALALIVASVAACGDSGNNTTPDKGVGEQIVSPDTGVGDSTIDLPAPDTAQPDTTADSGQTGPWTKMDNPANAQLRAIWGIDEQHVWAVGKGGAIVFFDGSSWRSQNNLDKSDLQGIYGIDLGQSCSGTCSAVNGAACINSKCYRIQAVGPAISLTYDGTSWTKNPTSTSTSYSLNAIFATPTKVFATSDNGYILAHTVSTSSPYWTTSSTTGGTTLTSGNPMRGIWGISASDVWAVGDNGKILHYTGSSWAAVTSPTTANLYAVWGTAADNVYAAGLDGTVLRWDGSTWAKVAMTVQTYFYALWGTGASNIFAVGQSLFAPDEQIVVYNGTNWAKLAPPQGTVAQGVWGTSPTNVFVVGNNGIIRYTGTP